MTRRIFSNDEVQGVSLELTTFCNLKCRLCAHNYMSAKKLLKHDTKDFAFWQSVLDKYVNLQMVAIAGILSEPTLYKDLFKLLDYLKSRKIKIELYTNGNTHDEQWWKELSCHLDENDIVVFTVCGSTQELHAKYRVGSDLNQLLKNAMAFKNKNNNDCCQHILFEYNKDDLRNGNMNKILKMFSKTLMINSLPYQERFNVIADKHTDICMEYKLSVMYKYIQSKAMRNIEQQRKDNTFKIHCKNLDLKFLWLDSNGKPWPCFMYQLMMESFNMDYTDILAYKHDFCFECEETTLNMLHKYGIEEMG